MKKILLASWVGALGAVACAPNSATLASAPPKAPDCKLEVISMPTTTERWEMLGAVSLGRVGDADPFAPENVAKIKPKACRMGGDAVSVSKAVAEGALAKNTALSYVIWRDKTKSTEPDPSIPSEI